MLKDLAAYVTARTITGVSQRLSLRAGAYGLRAEDLPQIESVSKPLGSDAIRNLGERLLQEGLPEQPLDEAQRIMRDTFRNFADDVVQPLAG